MFAENRLQHVKNREISFVGQPVLKVDYMGETVLLNSAVSALLISEVGEVFEK